MAVEASCHCGAVTFAVADAPESITNCNCSICRRYGVLWAYYAPADVAFSAGIGPTDVYMWDDRLIEFHRCRACGVVTHWAPVDRASQRMGVNARLFPLDVLSALRVRHLDGAGSERYVD